MADPAQLENALVNLCLNARDAMPSGGRIVIAATNDARADQPQRVCVSVADNGQGMSPEVRARALEPFFTTKKRGLGSGLGLGMVLAFAEQSGGALDIDSTVGKGTTVTLYLPRAEGNAAPRHDADGPLPPGQETILLVDDDALVRDYLAETLIGLGYSVVAHGEADGALAACAAGLRPDLLLSDVMLSGAIDGPQLAGLLTQRRHVLRVLFMTAYNETRLRDAVGGESQVIFKPFNRRDLAKKLRVVLDATAATAPNEGV
jgi:CheY-like chemotaxis protein/anti-sigma regulatory factor (Ser/Thr protein kinase)